MSFLTKLIGHVGDLAGLGSEAVEIGPERLAVAALLVHVARADGRFEDTERARLVMLLADRFGWSQDDARQIVTRADDLDREVDGLIELLDLTGHSLDAGARSGLLTMAYEVAAADGSIAEFEDDLVWRLGQLLGIDDAEITTTRNGVLAQESATDGARP